MEYSTPNPGLGIWDQLKMSLQRLQEMWELRWALLVAVAVVSTVVISYCQLSGAGNADEEDHENKEAGGLVDMLIVSFLGTTVLYSAHRILIEQRDKTSNPSSSESSKPRVTFAQSPRVRRIERSGRKERGHKIDPRYFKPRFIYSELMTIWDTTYTVISWGSVWIVGGTIMAGGRLAQKIKTKCTKDTQANNAHLNVFNVYCEDDEGNFEELPPTSLAQTQATATTTTPPKSPYRRVSSWTKKSCSAIKKKFSKATNAGMLRIEDVTP